MEIIKLVDGTERESYSTKETAEIIRKALKVAFPGIKFSVRTKYGSCYSATDISWTDGPTQEQVEWVTSDYTSRSFDGQTDSTNYHSQTFNGRLVKFSGWVNVRRHTSDALLALAARQLGIEQRHDYEADQMIYRRAYHLRADGLYVTLKAAL